MPLPSDDSLPAAASAEGADVDRPIRLDGAFPRVDAEDWRSAAEASLRGDATLDGLARKTLDGLSVDVLYHESPVQGRRTAPDPAAWRDADPTRRAWDNRSRAFGDSPDALAAHALAELAGGATSLELAVGGAGTDGDTPALPLDALPRALDGVHLDMITLSLRAGDATDAALDAVLALLDGRGVDPGAARVELDADPLGELARRGPVRNGMPDALERLAAVAARAATELPGARVVAVDTVVHHTAGASPCQELVAGIAAGTDYLDALLEAGLSPDSACRTLVFRVALDADIVAGVVKLRALERLWSHALASAGLPAVRPRVVVETSRRQLSRLAPWVNHLRNVAACTAAAIGGADTILVHPHDRVDGHRVGTDAVVADRVARNLPILLAEEGGLLAVDDAAGGSHAIESLTQATVERVWHALGELQRGGGLAASLSSGAWRSELARTQADRVARLVSGENVRVGVSRYRHDGVATPLVDVGNARATTSATDAHPTNREREGDDPHGSGEAADGRPVPLEPVREARAFEGDERAPAEAADARPVTDGARPGALS